MANVAGVLPVTPAGLGVIDSVAPLLLVSFVITRSLATLGVLGWRLVNFWLPIPAGAAAYVSLKVPREAGLPAMRAALATMTTRSGPQPRTSSLSPGTLRHPDLRKGRAAYWILCGHQILRSLGPGTGVSRRWNHGPFGPMTVYWR